jgi:hypothetical protein
MRVIKPIAVVPILVLALTWSAGVSRVGAKDTTYHPQIDPGQFQTTVDNPYLPLVPGTTFNLIEKSGRHTSENVVTVTTDTKVIMGVTCLVVHDVVREKGVLKEDTYDWYAQDKQGNVWYFGEDTKEIHANGKFTSEGSWEAGIGKNQPGIIMPSKPAPGAPYRQEYGPGIAEDMGQVVAVNDSVTVPYGSFGACVRTKEWSLLESGTDKKWYAKGVGFIREQAADKSVVTLVSVTRP